MLVTGSSRTFLCFWFNEVGPYICVKYHKFDTDIWSLIDGENDNEVHMWQTKFSPLPKAFDLRISIMISSFDCGH